MSFKIGARISWVSMAVGVSLAANAQQLHLTNLGLTSGIGSSSAAAINENGDVVGQYLNGNSFLLRNGVATTIPGLGGQGTLASSLNNSGEVAGFGFVTYSYHALFYSAGISTDLGTLGGPLSRAYGVNDAGTVVGYANTGTATHAFTFSNGSMADFTPTARDARAFAINNSGQVVGNADNDAFLYSNGAMSDLGTLGGAGSSAYAISGSGLITGDAALPGNQGDHAFIYSNGQMQDLGSLFNPGFRSIGFGINDSGTVVGRAYTTALGNIYKPMIYRNGVMSDVNTLLDASGSGYTILDVNGINDSGEIVGNAMFGPYEYAVVLSPAGVPEPTSVVVTFVGVGTLLARRQRRAVVVLPTIS